MRIALVHGETTYWLAGEPETPQVEHSDAGDVQTGGSNAILANYYVRGLAADGIPPASFEDRKNVINTVLFTTVRTFASNAAAELWALDYDGAFPRTGTLKIDTTPAFELASVIVSPPTRRVVGCAVILSYTVQGGAYTEVVPPEP